MIVDLSRNELGILDSAMDTYLETYYDAGDDVRELSRKMLDLWIAAGKEKS